jgi:hypothetical protein
MLVFYFIPVNPNTKDHLQEIPPDANNFLPDNVHGKVPVLLSDMLLSY